jgi:hypothetical protein
LFSSSRHGAWNWISTSRRLAINRKTENIFMNEDESRVHEIRSNALSERMLISQLESALTSPRTPHMKRQLNQILQNVKDVERLLRFAQNAQERRHSDAWLELAEPTILAATNIRQCIQKLIDVYGGPRSVLEVGGEGINLDVRAA